MTTWCTVCDDVGIVYMQCYTTCACGDDVCVVWGMIPILLET